MIQETGDDGVTVSVSESLFSVLSDSDVEAKLEALRNRDAMFCVFRKGANI